MNEKKMLPGFEELVGLGAEKLLEDREWPIVYSQGGLFVELDRGRFTATVLVWIYGEGGVAENWSHSASSLRLAQALASIWLMARSHVESKIAAREWVHPQILSWALHHCELDESAAFEIRTGQYNEIREAKAKAERPETFAKVSRIFSESEGDPSFCSLCGMPFIGGEEVGDLICESCEGLDEEEGDRV